LQFFTLTPAVSRACSCTYQNQAHSSNEACSATKKHLLGIFGAGPDLESAEVEYTEVEVSTLDPHRGK